MRRALAAVLGLALGCGGPATKDRLQEAARAPGPSPAYMPPGALPPTDTSRVAWYGNALQAMGEPRLASDTTTGETMRFLWLRTFHRAMAVRLVSGERGCLVVLTMLSGRSGTELGPIYRRDSTLTGHTQCSIVRDALNATGFRDALAPNARERDGSEWVFEVKDAEGYRVVVRWSPEISPRDRAFAAAGRAFLTLAAWDQAPDDPIY